jgi:hypothetical protein
MTVIVHRFGEARRVEPDDPHTLLPWCAKCVRIVDRFTVEARPKGAGCLAVECHGERLVVEASPDTFGPGRTLELGPVFVEPKALPAPAPPTLEPPDGWGPSPLRELVLYGGLEGANGLRQRLGLPLLAALGSAGGG